MSQFGPKLMAAPASPRPRGAEADEHQTGSEPDAATREPDEPVPGRPEGENIPLRIVGVTHVREGGGGADAGAGDRQVADHPASDRPEGRDPPVRPPHGSPSSPGRNPLRTTELPENGFLPMNFRAEKTIVIDQGGPLSMRNLPAGATA